MCAVPAAPASDNARDRSGGLASTLRKATPYQERSQSLKAHQKAHACLSQRPEMVAEPCHLLLRKRFAGAGAGARLTRPRTARYDQRSDITHAATRSCTC